MKIMLKSKFIFARQGSWGLAMLNSHLENSWEPRCFPSELAGQKKRTGWIVTARCMLKRQAELPTPNVRASNKQCLIMLKCYFKNCCFFQGCKTEKKSQLSSRQADRKGPDLQLTHLISDGGTQHTLSKPANSSFTLQILYSYSNSWILIFAKCGLCSLSSLELKCRSAGTRKDPKKAHAYALPLLFQHCDSA